MFFLRGYHSEFLTIMPFEVLRSPDAHSSFIDYIPLGAMSVQQLYIFYQHTVPDLLDGEFCSLMQDTLSLL